MTFIYNNDILSTVAASSPVQCFSSQTIIQTTENHNIINDTEKVTGIYENLFFFLCNDLNLCFV